VGVAPGLNPSIATESVSKGILGHLLKFQLMLIKESAVTTGQRVRDMCTATHIFYLKLIDKNIQVIAIVIIKVKNKFRKYRTS
jgi:hypothetical protein